MSGSKTNDIFKELVADHPVESSFTMGPYMDYDWKYDPKHLLFSMARYKFCAKMLDGAKTLLEIGCGDGFGSAILLQSVEQLLGIDVVPTVIDIALRQRQRMYGGDRVDYLCHNIIESPLERKFTSAISLDVIEHIDPLQENRFIANIAASLLPHAVCIIGTPNVTASPYASEASIQGHINLKSHNDLRELLLRYFHNIFIFSMNDEVVHTGFYPMSHYLLAMAVSPREIAF